jgi:hypothetical protein
LNFATIERNATSLDYLIAIIFYQTPSIFKALAIVFGSEKGRGLMEDFIRRLKSNQMNKGQNYE